MRLQNLILNLNGKINKSIFSETIRPKYFQYLRMVIIMLSNGDKICEKRYLSYLVIGILGKTYCLIQLRKTEKLKERKQTRSIMGQNCLSHLALLCFEHAYVNKVDIEKAIDKFSSEKVRSKFFFQPIFIPNSVSDLF